MASLPEHELFDGIEFSPIPTLITDARKKDNPIVAANAAFERLTGYSRQELLGRNCRILAGPETSRAQSALLGRAVRTGTTALAELVNYRRDGTPFRNAVMLAPLRDDNGDIAYFVGSQMDVSDGSAPGATATAARARIADLTYRQQGVLRLMLQGLRNKQIAAELGINEKTVKMHRAAMLTRLKVATSADAIRLAVEANL